MASPMIVNATEFDSSRHVGYSKPKVNASGGKSVNIVNPETQQVLNLSTPLVLTWGVSEFVDDKTGKRTYDMALQFPKPEYATPATDRFLAGVQAMEDKIKSDAVTKKIISDAGKNYFQIRLFRFASSYGTRKAAEVFRPDSGINASDSLPPFNQVRQAIRAQHS